MSAVEVLGIDPGGEYCGMALFEESDEGWACTEAWQATPQQCVEEARVWYERRADIVVEEFRLYPWLAKQQSFKTFPEVEVIGCIKLVTGGLRTHACIMQQASIKEPTVSQLRARRIKSKSKQDGAGGHAFDAETHGWHYILKTLGGRPAGTESK